MVSCESNHDPRFLTTGKPIFGSLSSASAGVSILFNNNFVFQSLKTFSDPNGRFVITDIKTESRTLTLVNIYAPNNDDPLFFE